MLDHTNTERLSGQDTSAPLISLCMLASPKCILENGEGLIDTSSWPGVYQQSGHVSVTSLQASTSAASPYARL